MADVRNCKTCGKIYSYSGGIQSCPSCKEKDEIIFKKVKDYLYDYPGASLSQVSTVLDISVERLKTYLKEGRLEIVGNLGNMILDCENCGKAIKFGRYCDECSHDLQRELKSTAIKMKNSLLENEEYSKRVGMRYLNKDQKNLWDVSIGI